MKIVPGTWTLKNVSLIILSLFLPLLSSCEGNSAPPLAESNKEVSSIKVETESFEAFLFRFAVEEEFQKSRIIDDWKRGFLNDDLEYEEKLEAINKWEYKPFFQGLNSFPIISNPKIDEAQLTKKTIEWRGIENGISVSMSFERIEGLWYLTAYLDQTT